MKINVRRIYTIIVVFFPLLSIYVSPVSGVDLGTLLFCGIGVFVFFENFNKIKIQKELLLLLFYTLSITIFSLASFTLYSPKVSILMRVFRFLILLFIFSFCNERYFNFKYGLRLLQKITIIASIYLIIQSSVYSVTGYILPKFIPGLTRLKGIVDNRILSEYANFYRPTSFFLEPSSFVYFSALMLVCSLFINSSFLIKKRTLTAILITVAMILSTSGQGFIVVVVVWGYWIILLIRKNQKRLKMYKRRIFLFLPFIFIWVIQSEIIKKILGRIFVKDLEAMSAVDARAGGYDMFNQLPVVRKIIGVGFGNLPDNIYFSSIADILFTLGIVGLIIIFCFYFKLFRKGEKFQKLLCVISFILMIGGGLFTATYLVFYLSFMMSNYFKKLKYI